MTMCVHVHNLAATFKGESLEGFTGVSLTCEKFAISSAKHKAMKRSDELELDKNQVYFLETRDFLVLSPLTVEKLYSDWDISLKEG